MVGTRRLRRCRLCRPRFCTTWGSAVQRYIPPRRTPLPRARRRLRRTRGRGSVGAGVGCTVGKLLGIDRCMRGGLGQASVALPGGVVVSALIAVNAVGDIVDPMRARLVAGPATGDRRTGGQPSRSQRIVGLVLLCAIGPKVYSVHFSVRGRPFLRGSDPGRKHYDRCCRHESQTQQD